MRVPLAVTLESRDGGVTKDAKNLNGLAEVKGEEIRLRKRPGSADLGLVKAGVAQFLFNWNGINAILADHFLRGTITTIVSGPTDTSLSPANASLMFTGAATNNNAATPRLFYKNRTLAKVVNRAGTHTNVTYASNMGAGTYSIISLVRVGAVATATIAEDVFNVGDTVTVAGASDAAYNGAKTVTVVTAGSGTAAADIPITITRSGTTATATTVSGAHGLTTATAYTIAGATPTDYNGSKTITVTGANTFTFPVTVTTAPVTPATGSPVISTWADLSCTSFNRVGTLLTLNTFFGNSVADGDSITLLGTPGGWPGTYTAFNRSASSYQLTVADSGALNGTGLTVTRPPPTVTGITRSGTTATITTSATHRILSGHSILVAGATQSEYNVGGYVTSVTGTTLTYEITTVDSPSTPATGSITVTRPSSLVNPTFSYAVAGTPATPDAGAAKTAASNGGTVPGTTYINGYFSVMDVSGVIWSSASDDPTTWDALDYVIAQFENGEARALVQSANLNVALKEWSTEFFYDRQDTAVGSPFSPVNNGFTRIGCASGDSYAYVGGGVAWLAQTKQEGRCAYWMVGTEQQRISTADIDRILNADDLATVYANGIEIDGHPLYVLTLVTSNITLVYDLATKQWGQWSSYTLGSSKTVSTITRDGDIATATTSTAHTVADGDPVLIAGATQTEYNGVFQASYVSNTVFKFKVSGSPTTPATTASSITAKPYTETYFKYTKAANYNGGTYFLHESDGHLYQMQSSLKRDAGLPINWFARTTRMDGGSTGLKRMASLEIVGDSVTDVAMIRWSDDDCATFSAYRFVDLSADRPITRKAGAFRRRTVEVRHVGNTNPVITALEMEIG